jgi:trigger factor
MPMQVTISELSPVEKKVAVEIPWADVAQKLDAAYRGLSRDVALKGFRKGKVPRPILERMFSRQVERDVVVQLVQESFIAAANQHMLQPVAEPVIDEARLDRGKPFSYSARVEVRSEVDPKDYEGVALERRAAHVTDEEVAEALERKRQELTEFKAIEGRTSLAATDVVVVALKGTIGDRPFERDGVMVDLSEPERAPLPGIGKALLGVPVDAKAHAIEFTLPALERPSEASEASSDTEPRGESSPQIARLSATVQEARLKVTPVLDDEFAKDTGEADTLTELKEKLRQKLLDADADAIQKELQAELVKEILKRNPFQVAPALVERQLDVLVQRTRLEMAMRGIDPREIMPEGPQRSATEQRVRDELRESAHDEVRTAFLIDAIATKEKIEVNDADLEKRLAEIAKARDKSVARLKAELQKEERLDGMRRQLRDERTLDLLLSRAKITEKT